MELISLMIPLFMNNHPSSSSVLNFVWHSQVSLVVSLCAILFLCFALYIAGNSQDRVCWYVILYINSKGK